MELQSPGSIFFTLGPITIHWYGIMVAAGFLSSTYCTTKKAERWGMNGDQIVNLALVCFIGGIIGARLYYAALRWQFFMMHPSEILWSPTEGFSIRGLSIHGGIFGALVASLVYCKRVKLPLLQCCDLISCALPLGQAIGRWGNFFNSEAFGRPVDPTFPLRLFIPLDQRPMAYQGYNFFHPTFLYESVWDFLLFILLYFVASEKLKKFPGLTFFIYIGGYSIGRLLIETLRTDSLPMPGMTIAAPSLVSAALIFVAMIGAGAVFYRSGLYKQAQ
jgi:phosphatidylglycerol:prolipoprotein diacylglycerol transferase